MVTDYFSRDMKAEKELANYLEKYYYPRIEAEDYRKHTCIQDQISGIDVSAKVNKQTIFIDEKGLLSITKPIRTFSLELLYKKNDEIKLGWLYDTTKKTTHYLFCWVKRDKVNLNIFKEKHIHYVLAMLVKRDVLLTYLETEYGITKESANEKALRIIGAGHGGRLENISEKSLSRYHYSTKYKEQPVNIVFDRTDFLASGAIESFQVVKRSEITKA